MVFHISFNMAQSAKLKHITTEKIRKILSCQIVFPSQDNNIFIIYKMHCKDIFPLRVNFS